MNNKKTDIVELSDKVLKGIREANYELVKVSAANNKSLIVRDKDGNIRSIPAKDLLKRIPK